MDPLITVPPPMLIELLAAKTIFPILTFANTLANTLANINLLFFH